MKRLFAIILTVALFSLALGVIAAQDEPLPNDPNVNEDANACLEGGSLEGKCGDSEYMWSAGWYKIRFEYGLIAREIYPDQFKWNLPAVEEKATADDTDCYIEATPGVYELATTAILNGSNGGNFFWKSPTYLLSTYGNGKVMWRNGVWYTGHRGDCSPL